MNLNSFWFWAGNLGFERVEFCVLWIFGKITYGFVVVNLQGIIPLSLLEFLRQQ